jgi:multisubunit Na+/H+ antiporter MnhE subunit
LGPWLGFNNTIVTGSLLLGLYLAYPVYWLTRRLFTASIRSRKEAT